MNPFKALRGLLFVLQSEHYDPKRFLHWTFRHYSLRQWADAEQRQRLVWTLKIRIMAICVSLLGILFIVYGAVWSNFSESPVGAAVINLLIFVLLLPFALLICLFLIRPFDFAAKKIIVRRAKQKIQNFPQLKIIGITGSYGKTTMKEVITSLLQTKFQVLSTAENTNTLLGVANLILKELQPHHEIFVCEMGAFQKGDIRDLCGLAPPHVSILTGVNEAHLERFGNLENTIEAKFEIVKYMREDGIAYLNGKNELTRKNAGRFSENKNVVFYPNDELKIQNIQWQKHGGYRFETWHKEKKLFETHTPMLGSYILDTLLCGILIAKQFDVPDSLLAETIPKIQPVVHRLSPIHTPNDVLIIDDAYNGNPDGAKEAMAVLKRFHDRRKIYLTPGLVEMGSRSQTIHEQLGKILAASADLVLLIRNLVTPSIEQGLLAHKFPKENIRWFETTKQAHDALAAMLKPGDVIVFQNDWSDNYF